MNRVRCAGIRFVVLTVCIVSAASAQNEDISPEQIKKRNKIKSKVHFTKKANKLCCRTCFFNCEEKHAMVQHVRECHVETKYRPYQCSNCSERSVRKNSIKQHVRKQHEGKGDVIDRRISVPPEAVPSAEAILKANTLQEGVHYFKQNGNGGLFQCSECPCSYYQRGCMVRHFKNFHLVSTLDKRFWRFQCSFCSYRGANRQDVTDHFASCPNRPCSQGRVIDLCLEGGKQRVSERKKQRVPRSGTRVKRQCRRDDHEPNLPGGRAPAERVMFTPSSAESTSSASSLSMLHTSRESSSLPMPNKDLLGDPAELVALAFPCLLFSQSDTLENVPQPPESPAAMWNAQGLFEEIQ